MVNRVLLIVSNADLMLTMWSASCGHDNRASMASRMPAIRSASVEEQGVTCHVIYQPIIVAAAIIMLTDNKIAVRKLAKIF